MKRHSFAIFLLSVAFSLGLPVHLGAQNIIPNGGFEQWAVDSVPKSSLYPTGTAFLPVGWGGGTFGDSMDDTSRTIYRSTDAHSGLYALGGKVTDDTLGPFMRTTGFYSLDSLTFPIVGSPTALEGWYKLKSVGNDYLNIIPFFDNSALAVFNDSTSHDAYIHFSIPFLWKPDDSGSGIIEIRVGNTSGVRHLGTKFVIDDLAFTGGAAVQPANNTSFGLEQNYPNPFNSSTTIRYSLPTDDNVTVEVLNMLGERVALLENGRESQGEHNIFFNGEHFASGPYLCRLITASQGTSSQIIQLSR